MKRFISFLTAVCLLIGLLGMVSVTAFAETVITTVELTMPEPEVGALFSETVLTTEEGVEYTVWSNWYESGADVWESEPLTEGGFEDGKEYILWGGIDAPGIQSLANVTSVTVNGEEVSWYFTDDLCNGIFMNEMSYTVGEPALIDQVTITGVTAPVVGQMPTTEGVVCNTEGVTMTSYWYYYNYEDNCYASVDGAFEEGEVYQLHLQLEAQEGYEFAYNAEQNITVDGEKPSFAFYYWSTRMDAELIYPMGEVEMVDAVMIEEISEFTVGQTISTEALAKNFVLPADAGYRISDVDIWNEDGSTADGTLEKGRYQIQVYLSPKEGYWFDIENMDFATPDGYETSIELEPACVTLDIEIDLRNMVSQVEITVPEFAVGDTITTEGITVTGGTLDSATWCDEGWGEVSGTFGEEDYILDIYIKPEEGAIYTDDTVILVNGEVFQGSKYVYDDQINIEYELNLGIPGIPIEKVELPAFPEAIQPGQTLEMGLLQVPEGAPYMAMMVWVDIAAGEQATVVAQQGMYACTYVIAPNEGYEFAEDLVITVGGQTYMGISMVDLEQAMVMQSYSVGYPMVSRIEMTVAEPEIGAKVETQELALETCTVYTSWLAAEVNDVIQAQQTDVFEKNMYYFLVVEMEAAEGYAFSNELELVINGKAVDAQYINMGLAAAAAVEYGKLIDPEDLEPGDFNMDGFVNDADALYLLRYTLFEDRYPITLDGDVNCDSAVTDADALYLLRYTLFPDRYPLYPEQ